MKTKEKIIEILENSLNEEVYSNSKGKNKTKYWIFRKSDLRFIADQILELFFLQKQGIVEEIDGILLSLQVDNAESAIISLKQLKKTLTK